MFVHSVSMTLSSSFHLSLSIIEKQKSWVVVFYECLSFTINILETLYSKSYINDTGITSHYWYIHSETPTSKAQGTMKKRKWQDCRNQRTRKSILQDYVLKILQGRYTYEILTAWPCKQDKKIPVDMSVWMGKISYDLTPKELHAIKDCWEKEN